MLCSGSAFGGLSAVTFVEAIDAACGINQLLLAGKERVAGRTDFDVQIAFFGRAGFERLTARAANSYFVIFGMNSWFHVSHSLLYKATHWPFSKHVMIGLTERIVKLDVSLECGGLAPLC